MFLKTAHAFLLFLTISFVNHLHAQQNEKSLLWEISGNGLEKPSYLFGTMHVKDKRVFFFGEGMLSKIRACEAFAGEIVMEKDSIKNELHSFLMPEGITLKTLLPKKDYKIIRKYARKNLGIYALMINKIKPIFTSALISEKFLHQDVTKNVDEFLQDYAKKHKVEVLGLETVKEQMEVLNRYNLNEQAEMLLDQVKNIDEQKKTIEEMVRLYMGQDLDSLYMLVNESDLPEDFNFSLIDDRNFKMADRMHALIRQKTVFVAVGAAHLSGENGIISLLRQKGYILKPVSVK
ncbi:MAG: TraB/GumN family protein [Cytophagaceae bacterium]